MMIFDTDQPITPVIPQLLAKYGELGVIRYIAPGSANIWKCLTPTEARAIAATNGKIKLGPVYETNGTPRGAAQGAADGAYARRMIDLYGVPRGGFMAYTSDEDAPSNLSAVGDAFKAFFDQMRDGNGYLVRRVAYAAGRTYDYLERVGAIDPGGRWVTQSVDFQGSRADIASGDFDIRQRLSARIFGLDTDPDVLRDGLTLDDLGFFVPTVAPPSLPDSVLPQFASTEDVEALQIALNAKSAAGLMVDGRYGPATTKAVAAIQKAHGLAVDGMAGPDTMRMIKGLA